MNISKKTIEQLELEYVVSLQDVNCNKVPAEVATDIIIMQKNIFNMKIIKAPAKKEVTYNWIMDKINSDKTFKNFAKDFNKLINIKGIDVYSTSYGIGVWCAYNRDFKNEVLIIENKLKELNIKYTNEFSDAGWVYRFRISKSKENINIIKSI